MNINIDEKKLLYSILGGIGGIILNHICTSKNKSDIRKEVINEVTGRVRSDVIDDIRNNIGYDSLTNRIESNVKKDITNHILSTSRSDFKNLESKMSNFRHNTMDRLDSFDRRITDVEKKNSDFDERIGNMVNTIIGNAVDAVTKKKNE